MYFLYEDGAMQFSLRDIDNISHCLQLSNTGRRNHNLVHWKIQPNIHECLWEFRFIIKCRDSLVLRGITLKFATRTNKSVNVTLHEISCQGKVSLFMLALLIGFAGKIAHLKRKEGPKKGHYFAFFRWKTWLKGSTTWLPWKTLRSKPVDRFSFDFSVILG